MKHKEEGYRLFPDDHVRVVGFPPGFADSHHLIYQEVSTEDMILVQLIICSS